MPLIIAVLLFTVAKEQSPKLAINRQILLNVIHTSRVTCYCMDETRDHYAK